MEKLTDVELSSVILEDKKPRNWEKENPHSVIVQVRNFEFISMPVSHMNKRNSTKYNIFIVSLTGGHYFNSPRERPCCYSGCAWQTRYRYLPWHWIES